MPLDPSISLQVKNPDMLNTMSSFLDLGNKKLQLEKNRQTFAADVARANAASQTEQAGAKVATANVQPLIDQQKAQTQTAQTGAEDSASNLQAKYQRQVAQSMSALIKDPAVISGDPKGIADALDRMAEQDIAAGVPRLNVRAGMAHLYQMAAQDPKSVGPQLQTLLQSQQNAGQQAATIQPSGPMVNNGQQQAQINTNPFAGPNGPVPGTVVQNLPPVGAQVFNPTTNAPAMVGPGGGMGPQTGPALGQVENTQANQEETKNIRAAGDQAPVQRNINQAILKLSRDTTTGPGSPKWQNALAAVSLGNYGDNYQELGKYLEKNAISNMTAMGGAPSNARLEAASAANGSQQYNPNALQEVTKFNDATNTAIEKFRQGVDKAVGLRNEDINALPEFKSAWAKNLDPNIFRAENAVRDGDTLELQRLKTELGPAGLKKLAEKRKALETLTNTGKLQ
jgi:hypothetical protein